MYKEIWPMEHIHAIAFDLDGTIIDSEPIHVEVEFEMFAQLGLDVPRAGYDRFQGRPGIELFREILSTYAPKGGIDPARLVLEKRALIKERYSRHLPVIPGAVEFIWTAREKYPLALTTSTGTDVQKLVLRTLGLEHAIGVIVTGDMVVHGKPHPEPYLRTVKHLGFPAAQVAVIEDAVNGVRSAKAAGCTVIGLEGSTTRSKLKLAGADLVVAGYPELYPLFGL